MISKIQRLFLLLFLPFSSFAQIVGGEAFLQGTYVEVGISSCGSFGTQNSAPPGYHPRSGISPSDALGFVCDDRKDGWADYCGDYFLPGSPEEGFGVKANDVALGNYAQCSTDELAGSMVDYHSTSDKVEATWEGTWSQGGANLDIVSRTCFPKDALYFITQVTITNPSESETVEDVFYLRNVDPDNDQTLPGCGNFTTDNSIVFQPPDNEEDKALVTAIGSCSSGGCFLGLGTKDSRARVTHGGDVTTLTVRDPENVWDAAEAGDFDCNPSVLSGTRFCNNVDNAISIAFRIGDIPPGESRTVSFAYILNEADLDVALDATTIVPQFLANDIDITESGQGTRCGENDVLLKIEDGENYEWTWSPGTYLNTTTGTEVVATPETSITYTVTGVNISTNACAESNDIVQTITLNVETEPEIELNINFGEGYCINDPSFTVNASPAGGTLLINDVPSTDFDPAALGVGTYSVVYNYLSPTSPCEYTLEGEVDIAAPTEVEILNLADEYCLNNPIVELEANEEGGTFRVNGSVQDSFTPSTLGVGTHSIEYVYVNEENCESEDTRSITIPALPTLSINLETEYCLNVAPITLTATPSGGMFTVNGISTTEFDPSALGVGNHNVVYTYTNTTGLACTNSTELNIKVNEIPKISFDPDLKDEYCAVDGALLTVETIESPSDGFGELTINGIPTNEIDLNVPDTYNIRYTYIENINGCEAEPIEKTILVNPLPVVASLATSGNGKLVFCGTESNIRLIVNIEGVGNLTAESFDLLKGGTVILDNVDRFDPVSLDPGNYTIEYFYTNPTTGCVSRKNFLDISVIENEIEEEVFDRDICPDLFGFELIADPSGESDDFSYLWTNAGGTTLSTDFILPLDENASGKYIVQVFDEDVCPLKLFTYNITIDCNTIFELPNAFSPNSDGLNDILEPLGQDFVKLDWKIYNRWGEIVFTGDDLNKQWNGMLRGKPAPAGTYIWKATYVNILEPDKVYKKKGKVTIVR